MPKPKKNAALALVPLCMVLALLNCNFQHPSEIPLGIDIAVDITPPVGEGRTADEFYIGETIELCISVLEPEALDSLQAHYAMRPVGKASVASAAPGDSVLTSGAIMEDNCFSVSFATPCTATVYGYARGEAGSVRDSVTIHVVERPDENVAPTLVAEVIRAHCTPEDPCSVSLVVGNEEPWQTIVLSAEPMPTGAEFHGDSLFVWRPGVDDIAGTREFVVRVTDNGNPPRSKADTVAVSVVDASQEDVYYVTYDGNGNTGGSVPASPQSYEPGTKVTVLSNLGGLHRTGYTFNDWNTDPHGHGADYAPEQTFTMGSNDVVLYAQWEMNPPVITQHPKDTTVHVGGSATFSVTANGPSLAYQWHKDGSPIGGATSTTYTISNAKATDEGEYSCIASNDGGNKQRATANLTVRQPSGMVLIASKGKSFQMGSTNGGSDEKPVHTVSFTYDYWLDRTEVTQKQYTEIMNATYAGFSAPAWSSDYGVGDNHPAYYVNWYDAVLYCNARSKKAGLDTVYTYTSISGTPGNDCELGGLGIDLSRSGFRLPTEAEWEYACRAGTTGDYYWGSGTIGDYAWYTDNSGFETHTVAGKTANGYGLYDMSGNVWEWCNDWYASYESGSQTDPEGPTGGSARVDRGGSWYYNASLLRSAARSSNDPANANDYVGFRVALPAQ